MTKLKHNYLRFICLVLMLVCMIPTVCSSTQVFAATSTASNVLDDLRTDEKFDIGLYPPKSNNYSLQLIQIAESTDGELLIYVYQPSGQTMAIHASSINIAREMNNSAGLGFNNYKLEYLNSSGVFFKYKVLNFKLKSDAVRYYNISNILRLYDSAIDGSAPSGNSISEVQNAVGQFWTASTVGDNVTYTMTDSETIEIPKKYVGYVEYKDGIDIGWTLTSSFTTAHFVAFSTDKPIDKLMQAELYFQEREVNAKICVNPLHLNHKLQSWYDYDYGAKSTHEPVIVNYSDKVSNNTDGHVIKGKGATWNRIQRTKDFIAEQNNADYKLTNTTETSIDGTQWVLNFHETEVLAESPAIANTFLPLISPVLAVFADDAKVKMTEVSDVMILRLMFEHDGKVYNLGVVDNKQTNDKQTGENREPGNEPTSPAGADFWAWVLDQIVSAPWWVWVLVGIIVLSVVITVLSCVIPSFGNVIKLILNLIGDGLYNLLLFMTAPFRWINRKFTERMEAVPTKSEGKSKPKKKKTSRSKKK